MPTCGARGGANEHIPPSYGFQFSISPVQPLPVGKRIMAVDP